MNEEMDAFAESGVDDRHCKNLMMRMYLSSSQEEEPVRQLHRP